MSGTWIKVRSSEGGDFDCYLNVPDTGGQVPAIVLASAVHGVDADIVAIAEVVRDLYRSESQPEQSYSERQLYEAALDRLSREVAAVQPINETEAIKEIEAALAKGPRRGPKPETTDDESVVEEEAA